MYEVKFIYGWNNSFELAERDITPEDLKFNDLEYDPERYVSEDFYLREPREAKITFYRHNFLVNTYVEPPSSSVLNLILYTDEDGNIIDETQYDPNIHKKEVVIDQYSKVLVKIFQDEEIIFLGFVKLNEVSDSADEIELTCVDFLDVFLQFAEQLKYNIPGDDSYGYYFSKGIIQNLLDIIENVTELNLKYTLEDEVFRQYISSYTIFEDNELDPENVTFDTPSISTPSLQYYTEHTPVRRVASAFESAVVFYQVFRLAYQEHPKLPWHYSAVILWKSYVPFTWSEVEAENYMKMSVNYNYDDFLDRLSDWEDDFLSQIEAGTAYIIKPDTYYYLQEDKNRLVEIKQNYYSCIIPYVTGQHSYLDLIKVITLTNNLTIYQKGDRIYFAIRTALPSEGDIVALTNNDILTPFSVDGISHDDLEFDVLEDLIYEDAAGGRAKNIENVKDRYREIFGDIYTKELETTVRRYHPITNEETIIKLGDKITFKRDKRWHTYLVVSHKKTDFEHKIRGYRTEVANG